MVKKAQESGDGDNISMRSGKMFAKAAESKEREKPQAKGAGSGLLKGIKGSETRNLGGDKQKGSMKSSRAEEGDGKGLKRVKILGSPAAAATPAGKKMAGMKSPQKDYREKKGKSIF